MESTTLDENLLLHSLRLVNRDLTLLQPLPPFSPVISRLVRAGIGHEVECLSKLLASQAFQDESTTEIQELEDPGYEHVWHEEPHDEPYYDEDLDIEEALAYSAYLQDEKEEVS